MYKDLKKNGASSSSSLSPSGSDNNGRANGYAVENCKRERERAKGLKWSSSDKTQENRMDSNCNGGGGSEGEEGYIFRPPPNTDGVSSRKRIKLQGMVSGHRCPVDPALVPRRVRSAMKKRVSQSASPPLSDSKRRQQHTSNATQLFNSSSAERFRQNMLDEVTKDEEEVAEALTSLASGFTVSEPVKTKENGRGMLEENSETRAPSVSPLEGPKEETTKILVQCNSITPNNPSPCVEDSHETMKADCPTLGQPAAVSVSQKSSAEVNGNSQPDSLRKFSSNVELAEGVAPLRDSINLSNPLGASLQYFPVNGMLQPTQLDSVLVRKQEMGLWPLGPTSMEHDVQSFKQKLESVTSDFSRTGPDVQPGLHNRGHDQLTIPSSSLGAVYPNSITVSGRPGNMNGVPAEKISSTSADKKLPWSKCTTHVNISRLIQSYQKAGKKQQSTPRVNHLKAKEGTNHSVPTSVEAGGSRNGMIPPLSSGALVERSMLESRNRTLQEGRLLQAQQAVAICGAYAPQKQGSDLLSSSAMGDTMISANGMKSLGQLQIPYPPNQAVMPFAFPRGAYTSQYQEQLAAGAAQQVQLQLPSYIAGNQLYGPHTGQASGGIATKQQQHQQQLMWQAHLAHYRHQTGFPPKWQQNGRQHDSSSSSPLISQPPSILPLPADYVPYNLQQPFIHPMPSPSSSSSSRSKQMRQHNGSGLNPQTLSQLHMICNTDTTR